MADRSWRKKVHIISRDAMSNSTGRTVSALALYTISELSEILEDNLRLDTCRRTRGLRADAKGNYNS